MKLVNLLLFFMLVTLLTVSCSSSNKEEMEGDGIELTEDGTEVDDGELLLEEEDVADNGEQPQDEVVVNEQQNGEAVGTGSFAHYQVQKNDTLMLVAFKIYGDYLKWRLLARLNSDQLEGRTRLKEGMKLQYERPNVPFQWNPAGDPYLIRRGDTLGKISNKVYGSYGHWKYIWDNNRPMIKNPSLIFAGFTLYYLQLRDIASQK